MTLPPDVRVPHKRPDWQASTLGASTRPSPRRACDQVGPDSDGGTDPGAARAVAGGAAAATDPGGRPHPRRAHCLRRPGDGPRSPATAAGREAAADAVWAERAGQVAAGTTVGDGAARGVPGRHLWYRRRVGDGAQVDQPGAGPHQPALKARAPLVARLLTGVGQQAGAAELVMSPAILRAHAEHMLTKLYLSRAPRLRSRAALEGLSPPRPGDPRGV